MDAFSFIPESLLEELEIKFLFEKWGLIDTFNILKFSFDCQIENTNTLKTLFFSSAFIKNSKFSINSSSNELSINSSSNELSINSSSNEISINRIPAFVTSMAFFDRIKTRDSIVRSSGSIRKCMEDYIEPYGIVIADELRKCLFCENTKFYDLFDDDDRNEFIFKLFSCLALGGGCCQYEDEIQPYIDTTRKLYKKLLVVSRNSDSQISIASEVYSVTGGVFINQNPYNNCFLCVDRVNRLIYCIYSPYIPYS